MFFANKSLNNFQRMSLYNKKKLLQQRSLDKSEEQQDFPSFLMMPASKNVDNGDQYAEHELQHFLPQPQQIQTENRSNSSSKMQDLPLKASLIQVGTSLLASLSVLSSGMCLGHPAITTQLLHKDKSHLALTLDQISWFASVLMITLPVGGIISGFLTEKFGRRNTMMIVNVLAVASWLTLGFATRSSADWLFVQLMIGRIIGGIMTGLASTPAVIYVSEICHPNLRGRMTLLSSPFNTALGICTIYLLGFLFPSDFRLVSFIAAGISFVILLCLFMLPESPVYLFTCNEVDKARKVLAFLRNLKENDSRIDEEITRIQSSKRVAQNFSLGELAKPEFYKPLAIMTVFFAVQQFCGIFVIFVYAAKFSVEAGIAIDEFLSAVIIGAIRVSTTIVIAYASDKFGRKPLAITSSCGMCASMLGLAACIWFELNQSELRWLSAVFLFSFILFGTFGVLTLPFAMMAEMYPQANRGLGVALTITIGYIFSFISTKTFPTIFLVFGNFIVFLFYAFVAFIGIIFAIFVLPETKGKSLQDIEHLFTKNIK